MAAELATGPSLAAQDVGPALRGRVIDAESGDPVPAATVELVDAAREAGEEDGWGEAGSGGPLVGRTLTDAAGLYRFEEVTPGRYVIRVQRLGFAPRSVRVSVKARWRPRVSVALAVEPIALAPIEVETPGAARLTTPSGEAASLGRIPAVRLRQELYPSPDTRLLTHADLEESVTLGELDVFRAIQRLPGVTTRDDFTAELWTRGASWGETRVFLDGLPLFNPLHGFGLFSGMSPRGVGASFFHPGVRPVGFPEGAAAVVDLRSRSGRGQAGTDAGLDVSLASAQLWAAAPFEGGGWAVTARRSYADWVADAFAERDEDRFPYDFSDVHGRLDLGIGDGYRLEVTGLWERDGLRDEIPDQLQGTGAAWGNVLAGVALSGPLGPHRFRQSVGGTWFSAEVWSVESRFDHVFNAPSEPPADHGFRYVTLRGELTPRTDRRWALGYDLTHQTTHYEGPRAWPYSRRPPRRLETSWDADLFRASVWGRRRWEPASRLTLETGVRVALGTETRSGSAEIVPSATLRFEPTSSTALALSGGRYVQYAQSPATVGPRVEGRFETGRLWTLPDLGRPHLDVSVGTLGGEAWLGDGWLASATAYLRETGGLLLPDPTPGPLIQRPPLVVGSATARGVEASVRKLSGRITGSVGYALSDADASALGVDFPAPTDRRHSLDVTALARLGRSLRVGIAYTYQSGAPFARVVECVTDDCVGVTLDRPFRRRGPAYSSLDLSLDFTHAFGGWSLGWYLQGRNLLGQDNAVTYEATSLRCPEGAFVSAGGCTDGSAAEPVDIFFDGIPTFPLLGIRVAF